MEPGPDHRPPRLGTLCHRLRHGAALAVLAALAALTVGCATVRGAADALPDPPAAPIGERGAAHGGRAADTVITALNFLGRPYRLGGNSADEGFDCSGFTRHIFALSLGLVLPRRADDQAGARGLAEVARSELQPGDLVFFNTLERTYSHVGIYVGDGRFIHAPRTGSEVRIEDMRYAYWAQRYTGARRAAGTVAAAKQGPSSLPAGGS